MIAGLGYAFTKVPNKKIEAKRLAVKGLLKGYLNSLFVSIKVFFQNPDDLQYFYKKKLVKPEQGVKV